MAAELISVSALPVTSQSFHQFSPAPFNCSFPVSNLAVSLSLRTLKCQHHHHHHVLRSPRLLPVLCSSSSSAVAAERQQAIDEVKPEKTLSKTRVLAQNLPWTTTVDDVRALFEKLGTVVEVEVPMYDKNKTRSKGLAFVEMGSEEEAAEAVNKLEGMEYEGRNLKMAYAFITKKPEPKPKKPIVFNLHVGNIPFTATVDDLRAFFESNGHKPAQAGVVLQGKPKRSAGYGFVSYATKREADAALSAFQGKEFMGREIQVAKSNRFVKVVNERKSRNRGSLDGERLQSNEQVSARSNEQVSVRSNE